MDETTSKNTSAGLLPILLFLVVSISIGAYGYSYYQWQQARKSLIESIESLNNQHKNTETNLFTVKGRTLQQAELLEGIQQRVGILEAKPSFFSLTPNKQRLIWQIGEATYLTKIASHKLSYEQDLLTAVNLLKEADELILTTHERDLYFLHQEIAAKIAEIQKIQLEQPNVLPKLEELIEKIEQLPAKSFTVQANTPVKEVSRLTEVNEDLPHWKRWLFNWWQQIKSSVQVRKIENHEIALPSFDITIHTLVNRLEQCKIAVWRQDENAYQHHLKKIETWVHKHFSNDNTEVNDILKDLNNLKQFSIKTGVPDLQPVIHLLTTAIENQQIAS